MLDFFSKPSYTFFKEKKWKFIPKLFGWIEDLLFMGAGGLHSVLFYRRFLISIWDGDSKDLYILLSDGCFFYTD